MKNVTVVLTCMTMFENKYCFSKSVGSSLSFFGGIFIEKSC